jgi:hypothetical protein
MQHGMLLALAVTSAASGVTRASDGLIYLGQTQEAARFNWRWDAYMRQVPKA